MNRKTCFKLIARFFDVNRLQKSLHLMRKFEAEEKQLYRDQVSDVAIESNMKSISVPPKPILLARSHNFMLFKPAKFKPASKQRVMCAC